MFSDAPAGGPGAGGLPPGFGGAAGGADSINEAALQSMMAGKSGGGAAGSSQNPQLPTAQSQPQKPREIGSLAEELVTRPLADIGKGLLSIFDIGSLFGAKPADDPEKKAKRQQVHQRWQQLTQEQQAIAQQRYQQEMQRKQMMAQEDEMRRQREQAQSQDIVMPSSPQKGAQQQGGSGKQRAMTKLKQDRTTQNNLSSAN